MKLSLILNTYQSPVALEKVCRGLSLQTEMPHEILVADDGSGDPTRQVVEKWREKVTVPFRHIWHEDTGFRRTIILNKAIAQSTGDYVVFLDGDCVPHPRFVADHFRLAEPGCWVQGRRCFVREPHVPEFKAGNTPLFSWMMRGRITGVMKAFRWMRPRVVLDQKQRGILGCNMGIWRGDLIAVNGLDEEFLGWGREDSDLGMRLYHLGRKRKLVHGWAVLYHLDHPFVSRDSIPAAEARLNDTIASRKVRCVKGVAQYLAPGSTTPAQNP